MGGTTFTHVGSGKTAAEAFKKAGEQARYDHGHSGYTGTIAEKSAFTVIPLPPGEDPFKYADKLIDDGDPRIDDKWGPAGCIKLPDQPDKYLFFGWASC